MIPCFGLLVTGITGMYHHTQFSEIIIIQIGNSSSFIWQFSSRENYLGKEHDRSLSDQPNWEEK
jgi:hypothetical protein